MTLEQAIELIEISGEFEKSKSLLNKFFLSLAVAKILKGRRAYPWDIRKIPEWLKSYGMHGTNPEKEPIKGIKKTARWIALRIGTTPRDAEKNIRVKEVGELCYEILQKEIEDTLRHHQSMIAAQAGSGKFMEELTKQLNSIKHKLMNLEYNVESIEKTQDGIKKLAVAQYRQSMFSGLLSPV